MTETAPARYAGFDGLRATAATLVFLHHAGFISGATFQTDVGPILGRMDVGVPIFFVISGFLLFRPIVVALLVGAWLPSAGRFYRRRFVRIFPAYWVALGLILVTGGGIAVQGASGLLFNATLTQGYHPDRALTGITQAWSLVTEVAFYVALPLFATLIAPAVRRAASLGARARRLLAITAAVYAGSVAFRVLIAALDPSWRGISRQWLPSLADYFALGMALAIVSAWSQERPRVRAVAERVGSHVVLWWGGAAFLLWFVSMQLELPLGLEVADFTRETFRQGVYGLIGLCLVAPLALAPGDRSPVRRLLDNRVMAWLGVISYGFFLWHQFAFHWIMEWSDWLPGTGHLRGLVLLGYPLSVAIAWCSYVLVERPASSLLGGRGRPRDRGAGIAGNTAVVVP